jgi:hypothetical protein
MSSRKLLIETLIINAELECDLAENSVTVEQLFNLHFTLNYFMFNLCSFWNLHHENILGMV